MGAKYLYRMDDITPDMDWGQFWRYMGLFEKHGVRPILGVVPDNQDPALSRGKPNKDFWKILRELKEQGMADIAQHGYRHKLHQTALGKYLGITGASKPMSEFAGLPYEVQYERIAAGQRILDNEGLRTDIWMAPCHTFDPVTLKVLRDLGFRRITDGISLYPFRHKGLVFIPQQLWQPRWFPVGILTVCIHSNTCGDALFRQVVSHLESNAEIISLSRLEGINIGILRCVPNSIFRVGYKLLRSCKGLMKR